MADVIVVGGGVVGLTIAWELAGQGTRVLLCEQGTCGAESSWAGAGMLPPGEPRGARDPAARLRAESHVLWPELSAALREATGVDNGFRREGGLVVHRLPEGAATCESESAAWRAEGVRVERVGSDSRIPGAPVLGPAERAAYFLPDMGQVRNPRHVRALIAGCAARGVEIREGEPVVGIEIRGERVAGVRTASGLHPAGTVCIAGGAWSRSVLGGRCPDLDVTPVRGQIVLLRAASRPFACIVEEGLRYVVPRDDGRVLIGSTEDRVGFDRRTTGEGIAGLLSFALELVPALRTAAVERTWAGLRPGTGRGVPTLGPVPGTQGLFVATGHYRTGLQMSPITGRLLAAAILGRTPSVPLAPYLPPVV